MGLHSLSYFFLLGLICILPLNLGYGIFAFIYFQQQLVLLQDSSKSVYKKMGKHSLYLHKHLFYLHKQTTKTEMLLILQFQ